MRSNTAFQINVVHFMGRNMSWHFRAQELYRSTFLNASDGLWRFKVCTSHLKTPIWSASGVVTCASRKDNAVSNLLNWWKKIKLAYFECDRQFWFFLILKEPPHSKQFSTVFFPPDGCDCGNIPFGVTGLRASLRLPERAPVVVYSHTSS